jgi:hypothetical protein
MILTVVLEGISKAATALSGLMTVYTIPCHDRGYVNIMLVLQSSSDPLRIVPGASSETNATSGGVYNISNIEVEEDVDVIEGIFLPINEELDRDIKQEEIPGPDEVSYICMCLLLDTFSQCPRMLFFFFL